MISQNLLRKTALKYRPAMVKFCRDILRIPSLSNREDKVLRRCALEMRCCGFEKIKIDRMGNLIGQIGSGRTKILMDAHLDTVAPGPRTSWRRDPYSAWVEGGKIYGRGASDQKGAIPPMIYAARIIKELRLLGDFTLYAACSVDEEDCEGMSLMHIIKREGIRPDAVIITEPSDLKLKRGQRGRMEMQITTPGKSCHASMPHLGDNAVTKMGPILADIDRLNSRLKPRPFTGKGSITITEISSRGASGNSVPQECMARIDRRLAIGETARQATAQVAALPSVRRAGASVRITQYSGVSWRGLKLAQEEYFPAWMTAENHPLVRAGVAASKIALGRPAPVGCWPFSTNGVGPGGRLGIPCLGFGPSIEGLAHTANEYVPIEHMVRACAFYAALPIILTTMVKTKTN